MLQSGLFASSNIRLNLHNKSNVRLGSVQQVYNVIIDETSLKFSVVLCRKRGWWAYNCMEIFSKVLTALTLALESDCTSTKNCQFDENGR